MTRWKTDLMQKDKKMGLLRDAIIKLKEEFLKAQEIQAEELVRHEKKRNWTEKEEKTMEFQTKIGEWQAKCQMLTEKLEN